MLPHSAEAFDPRLVTLKLDDLLSQFTRKLAGTTSICDDADSHEFLDGFGALVHACLATDFEFCCKTDSFAHSDVREDYDRCPAPILSVWNALFRKCALVQPAMMPAVSALYRLQRDLVVHSKAPVRVNTKLSRSVQTLTLFSVLAHLFPLDVVHVSGVGDMLAPSWLYGLRYMSKEAAAYTAGTNGLWEVAAECLSYRRAALEVQAQLAAQVLARSRCCFSDHVVFTDNSLSV